MQDGLVCRQCGRAFPSSYWLDDGGRCEDCRLGRPLIAKEDPHAPPAAPLAQEIAPVREARVPFRLLRVTPLLLIVVAVLQTLFGLIAILLVVATTGFWPFLLSVIGILVNAVVLLILAQVLQLRLALEERTRPRPSSPGPT